MIKVFEVPVAQPDSYSLSKRREMWLEKPVGTNSERAVGSVGLRNYGLPT
jgi:hypothetical protein